MIDAKLFWQAIGARPTAVPIVTARGVDGPAGFLGLSVAHVTAAPPSVLVSIDDETSALEAVLHSRHFAINYLPAEAESLVDVFSGKTEQRGADRFRTDDWDVMTSGAPTFRHAISVIDCELAEAVRYASTTVAIGRVIDLRSANGEALVYFRGQYLSL